jgi:hypothetical protein
MVTMVTSLLAGTGASLVVALQHNLINADEFKTADI